MGNANPEEKAIAHIRRAKAAAGDKRESFDGQWAIEFQGEFAGIISMTKVDLDDLPPEHAIHFPKESDDDLYLSVGYALNSKFRGQGLASRSLNMIVDFSKTQLHAKYLFASTNKLNESSQNVLTRAGFDILPTSDVKRVKFYKLLTE